MAVRVVRLGKPRQPGEGTRIGTVRRPPRGVPKERFASDDWYDSFMPQLAPSAELVKQAQNATTDKEWRAFVSRYRREMASPDNARLISLLATLSRNADFSIGCYCENEDHCHTTVLRDLLDEHGAEFA